MSSLTSVQLDNLLRPQLIRERAQQILELAQAGKTGFEIHTGKLAEAAAFVIDVMTRNYPDGYIPPHSRWDHFQAGKIDRLGKLAETLHSLPEEDQLRARLDLVIVSVLLDAGAGMKWSYQEKETEKSFSKSEGLAIASLKMFEEGAFSSDRQNPLRVDADALAKITPEDLKKGFQVTESNPLVGLDSRTALLNRLGACLKSRPDIFGHSQPRLGNIITGLTDPSGEMKVSAVLLLKRVLTSLSNVWPERMVLNDIRFGDVWMYEGFHTTDFFQKLVPFHKLSQWLTYSMIPAMRTCGWTIEEEELLTGLPEYRNGGLFVDMGVLIPRDVNAYQRVFEPDDSFIVEWRALTICLLDQLADAIRIKLKRDANDLTLAKILQGGTWAAGRVIARQKRKDGGSPFQINSDGTVF